MLIGGVGMYKLKLATKKEDIIEFEQKRAKAFSDDREITTLEQCSYGKAIEDGDMLAFLCMKGNDSVGGMLIQPNKRWIYISHLFVDKDMRKKGAGSFMLDYVNCHKEHSPHSRLRIY